jgi:hypothetical protein
LRANSAKVMPLPLAMSVARSSSTVTADMKTPLVMRDVAPAIVRGKSECENSTN